MATNDPDSIPVGNTVPSAVPTAPYPPSPLEAKRYYYGIPSQPHLVARSSANVWVQPTGLEAYFIPKEASPIGLHPLQAVWEVTVGPAIVAYLDSKGVKWTSLDPVRMGQVGESSPPVIIWVGVVPSSLSAQDGIEVAVHCKTFLTAQGIDDVHVEIRESEVIRSAKMYKPVVTSNPTARVREPFTTALGIPICAEITPYIEGTGGFFISDSRFLGKIYLVTARHVVFHPEQERNELYQHHNSSKRRNVLLFGDAAIEKYIKAIEHAISVDQHTIVEIKRRLKNAEKLDEEDARAEKEHVQSQSEQAKKAIEAHQAFLADVSRDWKKSKDRVLGHVVLSPPLGFNVGEEGFTEDWAVIEIDASKVNSTNFVGNAIDLGTTMSSNQFRTWMHPHPANPSSFTYPVEDRLHRFHGTIPDKEMWKPGSRALDHDNEPCIMVIKRGYASDLTIGHLNGIRSFTRIYCKDLPSQLSKEVAIWPRNSKSGAFSSVGDSGSAVVDGKGRMAGLITSGAGDTEVSDCTYLTSINFLLKRMSLYGLQPNLFPSLNA